MAKQAQQVAPDGVTWLGDALDRNPPRGKVALDNGFHFLCVCKPASHATLSARLAFWPAHDGSKTLESRHWHGRLTDVTRDQEINDGFFRGGPGAVAVHGLERMVLKAKTGAQLSHPRCPFHTF